MKLSQPYNLPASQSLLWLVDACVRTVRKSHSFLSVNPAITAGEGL